MSEIFLDVDFILSRAGIGGVRNNYPQTVLLLGDQGPDNDNAVSLIKEVYQRSSRGLKQVFTTGNDILEIVNEIAHY